MEKTGKVGLIANKGWLQGMKEGKRVWFDGKLYKAVSVGSCSTRFIEEENPRIYYKILNNIKFWVDAIWKSFLWGLKRG